MPPSLPVCCCMIVWLICNWMIQFPFASRLNAALKTSWQAVMYYVLAAEYTACQAGCILCWCFLFFFFNAIIAKLIQSWGIKCVAMYYVKLLEIWALWRRSWWASRDEYIGLDIYFNSLGQICLPMFGLSACGVPMFFLAEAFCTSQSKLSY